MTVAQKLKDRFEPTIAALAQEMLSSGLYALDFNVLAPVRKLDPSLGVVTAVPAKGPIVVKITLGTLEVVMTK